MDLLDIQKKEILFGCLLGDANLQTYTQGKTWRARFVQSDPHKSYLMHLHHIFAPFVKTPPKRTTDNFGNIKWYFNTTVHPDFKEFALYFYHNKNKVVPNKDILLQYLTPLALSYWFMDDGSLKTNCKAYYLCTDSFSLDHLKVLECVFLEKFNLRVNFHKKGNAYRLYIPRVEYFKFRGLIEPYIHPNMYYKLPILSY